MIDPIKEGMRKVGLLLLASCVGAPCLQAADSGSGSSELGEIVVTARKREESVMRTPVTVSVVTQQQISDLKIVTLHDLTETVSPDARVSYGFGPVGTIVYLRGIGSGDSGTYVDQSVALNIDGISMSHGVFYNAGSFDMSQIEVLKGPQGLFYGKSTTAGIIALHTADPTSDWQSEVSLGNEFVANEQQVNAFVSGPITDKLTFRVAGYYDTDDHWRTNPNTSPGIVRKLPQDETFGGRLTLKYDDPDAGFNARLKVTAINTYTRGSSSTLNQGFNCPLGVRQTQTVADTDNCRLDKYSQGYGNTAIYNPNIDWYGAITPADLETGSPNPLFTDGRPYTRNQAVVSSLDLNFEIGHGLTLSSVTGFSWAEVTDTAHSAFGVNTAFDITGEFAQTDYSEELRLTSDWKDRWFNFMVGVLNAPSRNTNTEFAQIAAFNAWGYEYAIEQSREWSGFSQLLLTPFDKWEIAPGVRYTRIKKYFTDLQVNNNFGIPGNINVNQAPLVPFSDRGIIQNNVSPELTVTYHPTDDWTLYGSLKKGYKGPGFNNQTFLLASYNPAFGGGVNPFGGEKVKGGEVGLKGVLFDRRVDVSFTPYLYKFTGLQVSNYNYVTNTIQTQNGANAKTYGADLSGSFRPIENLQFNGFVAYNHAEFTSFPASPCWGGQTEAQGCSTASGAPVQDLKGQTLNQAPRWTGSLGADFTVPMPSDYRVTFSANGAFSSSYLTVADLLPSSHQNSWFTVDAAARLRAPNGAWEVAVIGRNLSNKYYALGSSDAGTITPGVMGDAFGFTNRGRQIMLQVTARPSKWF